MLQSALTYIYMRTLLSAKQIIFLFIFVACVGKYIRKKKICWQMIISSSHIS